MPATLIAAASALALAAPLHAKTIVVSAGEGAQQRLQEALIVAAKGGHIDIVKLLLANRADPNKADESGETAFDIALKNQNTDIAELLRKAGGKSGKTITIEFK